MAAEEEGLSEHKGVTAHGIHVVAKSIGPMSHYNEPGLHYLCSGYKKFFKHIRKYLHAMTQLLGNGLPASYVMDAVKGSLVIKLDGVKKAEK